MIFTPGHQSTIEAHPTIIPIAEKIREDCCDLCQFIDPGNQDRFAWKACELAAKRCFDRSSCGECKSCGCFKKKAPAEFRNALDMLRGEA